MAMQISELTGIQPDPRTIVLDDAVFGETCVGVEIELEGLPNEIFERRLRYWKIVEDGSLRNGGAEFVFKKPLGGADIRGALNEFRKVIAEYNPQESDRTSIHVHVDVRDLDMDQLRRFIMMYIVCEKPLYKLAGEDRIDNIFCYSFQSAQGAIGAVKEMLDGSAEGFRRGLGGLSRYYGCNLAAVEARGSVEFRLHAGTHNTGTILTWVNTLLQLKEYAVNNQFKPDELFANISVRGPEQFMREVFVRNAEIMIYDDLAIDLFDGVRLAQDFLIDANRPAQPAKADFVREGSVYEQYYIHKHGQSPYVKRDGDAGQYADFFGVDQDIIDRIARLGLDFDEVVREIEGEENN